MKISITKSNGDVFELEAVGYSLSILPTASAAKADHYIDWEPVLDGKIVLGGATKIGISKNAY